MTGRYQTRFGHEWNILGPLHEKPGVGLPLKEVTLADVLKSAGYATGIVGKWHLGKGPEFQPQKRGFDEFFGFLQEGHFYVPPPYRGAESHLRNPEPAYDRNNPMMRGTQVIEENQYLTEAFTREATAFIDRHAKQPFFLYLAYNAIHSPMQAKVEYFKRSSGIPDQHRRVFAGMLSCLDDSVGAVLARLREKRLEEDTLVFCISDNGGPTEELTSSNKPLRGGKGQLFEGGIRIPFLAQWKGRLPANRVYDQPVISLDIFATAAAAAGAATPAGRGIDGVNLLPYLSGQNKSAPHETLFWRHNNMQIALRKGNWKLIKGPGRPPSLFDLSSDIGENTDLAQQKPEIVRELESMIEEYNRQMVPPLWQVTKANPQNK